MYDFKSKLEGKVVCITGANGYIGSALTKKLEKYAYKVIRVTRKKIEAKCGVEDWTLDLSKEISWVKIIRNSDIIFHLSGNTSINYSEKNPVESLNSTLIPIIQMISAAKKISIQPRVVFSSTATIYGLTEKLPVSEKKKQVLLLIMTCTNFMLNNNCSWLVRVN